MHTIDLHGYIETEAIVLVNTALWELEDGRYDQLHVITGNGGVLKNLVIDMAISQGFECETPTYNQGLVIIHR